jgi:hypothetical protein
MHLRGSILPGFKWAVSFSSILSRSALRLVDFFSAFMHGLDLKSVKAAAPLSFGRVLYGIVGLSIVGFVAGFVFAWTYNVISRQ